MSQDVSNDSLHGLIGGEKLLETLGDTYTLLQSERVWELLERARDVHTSLHLAKRALE